jgi:hypothetical protein
LAAGHVGHVLVVMQIFVELNDGEAVFSSRVTAHRRTAHNFYVVASEFTHYFNTQGS